MTYIRDMETLLGLVPLDEALQALEDRVAADRIEGELRSHGPPTEVDWSRLVTEAGALAAALEQLALDAGTWAVASVLASPMGDDDPVHLYRCPGCRQVRDDVDTSRPPR